MSDKDVMDLLNQINTMEKDKDKKIHAASPVAQNNQGRVQDLGRGSCSKSTLQSPLAGFPSGVTAFRESSSRVAPSSEAPSYPLDGSGGDAQHHIGSSKVVLDDPVASGSGTAGNLGPSSSAAVDQQHSGLCSGKPGLTKAQKRNLRKKAARLKFGAVSVSGAGAKRLRWDGSAPSLTIQKRLRQQDSTGYAGAVKSSRVAIVGENFPADKLSEADCGAILATILERIDTIPGGESLPLIRGHELRRGALFILCDNPETDVWIRGCFDGNRETLEGRVLRVLSASELPKPAKVAFKTKDVYTRDPEVFRRRLSRLNPGLKSGEWRFLQFTADEHFARWIFGVEQEDVEDIRRAKFGALTGIDRGVFKILQVGPVQAPVTSKSTVAGAQATSAVHSEGGY